VAWVLLFFLIVFFILRPFFLYKYDTGRSVCLSPTTYGVSLSLFYYRHETYSTVPYCALLCALVLVLE